MLHGVLPKADRRTFNSLSSTDAVLEFLHDYYGVTQQSDSSDKLADMLSTITISSDSDVVS